MSATRRAIVVGAGPGGLTTAVALRRAGVDVTVFERAPRREAAGSGLTLWPNATRALERLGILPSLAALSRPLERIAMRNWRGRVIFEDPLAPFDEGGRFPGVALLRAELVDVLGRTVADATVFDARLTRVQQTSHSVVAHFADGRRVTADVLIAADGLHSAVRAQLVPEDLLLPAGYGVWRGIAPMGSVDAVGTTWMGPGQQFGMFPLAGDRIYWFASTPGIGAGADRVENARATLVAAFADWPAPIPQLISATDQAALLYTDIYDRPPLDRWTFGRVALLGDAAHPAAPTLGQGACQAIEDGVVLGSSMACFDDPVEALRRYEARRVRRANLFVAEARRIGRLGLWHKTAACWLRDRVMGAMPAGLRRKQLARMFAFSVSTP